MLKGTFITNLPETTANKAQIRLSNNLVKSNGIVFLVINSFLKYTQV